MKVQIERDRLLKPLTLVSSVVERRQTLPILANVYMKLDSDVLTLTGTDLEVEVTNRIDGVKGDGGECTVTARKLLDICRALPGNAKIQLEADGGTASLRSGRSRFTLQTLPAKDYPKIETSGWEERLKLNQGELKQVIENTAFSMAQQDVRYYLNGLLVELSGKKMVTVATDGHRLAKSELVLPDEISKERQAIVPRKSVVELSRFLQEEEDSVTVEFNNNHVRVNNNGSNFTSKLIDGRFPDYQSVMSPTLSVALMVNNAQFHDVLARTAILTNEKFRGVRLELDKDKMRVSAHNPEQEEASDELPLDYDGTPLEIGFNVNYLMDALKALPSEEVELRLEDANSSCTLNTPGDKKTKYLVMPMRL